MPGGVVPYDVMSPYEALLRTLDEAAAKANCGFTKVAEPLIECFRRQDDGSVVFHCVVHLQEWRVRKEQLHILLHIQETISPSSAIRLGR